MLFYPPFKKKIQYLEVMNMEFVKGKKKQEEEEENGAQKEVHEEEK